MGLRCKTHLVFCFFFICPKFFEKVIALQKMPNSQCLLTFRLFSCVEVCPFKLARCYKSGSLAGFLWLKWCLLLREQSADFAKILVFRGLTFAFFCCPLYLSVKLTNTVEGMQQTAKDAQDAISPPHGRKLRQNTFSEVQLEQAKKAHQQQRHPAA